MYQFLLIASLSLILFACNEPANSENQDKSGLQKSATNAVSDFKGVYYFDPARAVFKDCKSMADYTVVDQTDSLEGKYIEMLPFRHEKEPLSVELAGYLNLQQDTLFVTQFQQISLLNIKAACFAPVFQCSGNEPFWSLTIHPDLKLLIFRDYSHMESHLFDYQAPLTKGNKSVFSANSVGGEMIEVVVTKETCSDGMSDQVYEYKAEISFRDQKWRGCAVK